MSRSALFACLFSATLVLPTLAIADCGGHKTRVSSCADGMSWSVSEGKCVPRAGS